MKTIRVELTAEELSTITRAMNGGLEWDREPGVEDLAQKIHDAQKKIKAPRQPEDPGAEKFFTAECPRCERVFGMRVRDEADHA